VARCTRGAVDSSPFALHDHLRLPEVLDHAVLDALHHLLEDFERPLLVLDERVALVWFGIRVLGDQPALMKDPNAMIDVLKEKSHYLIGFAVVIGVLYFVMVWMQRRAKRAGSARREPGND
jgi:hypothetical protein